MRGCTRKALVATIALALQGCLQQAPPPAAPDADTFYDRVNAELADRHREAYAAGWVHETNITPDTEFLAARAEERFLEWYGATAKAMLAYEGRPQSAHTARAFHNFRLGLLPLDVTAPAPEDPAKRAELTRVGTALQSMYGAGRYCEGDPETCHNIDDVTRIMASSRDYDELLATWRGWHSIGAPMRQRFERFVALSNEGARSMEFADLGEMWRSGYDETPAEFAAETDRLWEQVRPLYDQLHCYARARLQDRYGKDRVADGDAIPAHLLGNVWAQDWTNIYDLLEPYPGKADLDVTRALVEQHYTAERMTRSAESFYTSLGFPALPASFWERSMLTRPRDREVVCHASAWQMDDQGDVRIKQCIVPNEEELRTIYHELGHVYYYLSYRGQPLVFQTGANDGFHEAIGDTVLLSMTPSYLASVGLTHATRASEQAVVNGQMKLALDRVAFLPWGLLVDRWRWGVFSGEIAPSRYNSAWWALRRRYQGVAPPVARSESDFDPAAKYHVAANTPYTRYFLAFILQFQFHEALCEAAGFKGPLHECSIAGNRDAGRRFQDMLALGSSRPWPEALEKLTGGRRIDAGAMVEYFAPLSAWLARQNEGRPCGWSG